MNENESIDDMITKFTKMINGLASLDDEIDSDQKVKKIIQPLPQSWEVKSITLNAPEEMEIIGLIRNLKTNGIERKAREKRATQKKKTLVFKSTSFISEEEDDD